MISLWQVARARNAVMDVVLTLAAGRPDASVPLRRVGGDYGGFWIPSDLLDHAQGLLVSGGIGFDVNFERAFADCGYLVIAMDPLQDCIEFARGELRGQRIHLVNAGLWSTDDRVTFYAPREKSHDSWSAVNIQETPEREALEFQVISLRTVSSRCPDAVSLRPALLKLNIEGAEAEVLGHLWDSPFVFDVIAVHLESLSQVRLRSPGRFVQQAWASLSLLRALREAGYRVARSRNLEMTLLSEAYLQRGVQACLGGSEA